MAKEKDQLGEEQLGDQELEQPQNEQPIKQSAPVDPEIPKEAQMVTIPKSILEQLMTDVQNLKSGNRNVIAKRVTEHIATIKMVDGNKPVVGIVKTWLENPHKPEERTMCRVKFVKNIDSGETEERVFDLLEFLNNEGSCKAKIVKQEANQIVKSYGLRRKINPDPVKMGDDGKNFTPGMVEDEVVSVEYTATMEFLEGPLTGKTLTIDTRWLNM